MTYVGWAVLYEGATDQAYFDVIIPRLMEDIILLHGTRHATIPIAPAVGLKRGSVEAVAREACAASEAFHLVFIHADTGGRGLETRLDERSYAYCGAMNDLCDWPPARCVPVLPRHETEAWVLADPQAVTAALGYNGSPNSIGLPADAIEAGGLVDPKAILAAAIAAVRGRRREGDVKQIMAAIAQKQSLAELRRSTSFSAFEAKLFAGLASLGCVKPSV